VKIQQGSLRIWEVRTTGLFWASCRVTGGRTTQLVKGPESLTQEDAIENLKILLKARKSAKLTK
jgi:hypothetical protein